MFVFLLLDEVMKNARKVALTASFAGMATLIDPMQSAKAVEGSGPGYLLKGNNSDGNVVRLKPCSTTGNCVSSNYLEPPNRYVSPLKIVKERDMAFQRAVSEFQKHSEYDIVEVLPRDYYIHLTIPGTAPGSLDDLEVLFSNEGGILNVRCEARVSLPPPPFCVKKNCINGSMDQRQRVENMSYMLGLPPVDQSRMNEGAKWTPIFLNSDRVPAFDDIDDGDY